MPGTHGDSVVWDKTGPDRLAEITEKIKTYKVSLHSGLNTAHCNVITDNILREIYDAHIESLVPTPRPTFVKVRQYPSLDLLTFVELRFSGDHMDVGWNSPEILSLQHYELLIDTVMKNLPNLLT